MNEQSVIDLSRYSSRVYTGRENGDLARERLQVEDVAKESTHIVIRVPDDTKTLNPSFLLGFVGDEIVSCGSREQFLGKFEFDMPDRFRKQLNLSIKRALSNQKDDSSLI